MDEIVLQEGGGVFDAELFLQQQSNFDDMGTQKVASDKFCRRELWQAGGKWLLGIHHLVYPCAAALAPANDAGAARAISCIVKATCMNLLQTVTDTRLAINVPTKETR